MTSHTELREWIKVGASLGAALVGTFTLIWGLFEYSAQRHAALVAATVEHVNLLSVDPVLSAQNNIEAYSLEFASILDRELVGVSDQSQSTSTYEKLLQEFVSKYQLEADLSKITRAYESLALSSEHGLIDKELTFELVGREVRSFRNQFHPYLVDVRERTRNPNFAINIDRFVASYSEYIGQ